METELITEQNIVTREQGNALELAVEHIFKIAGFKTEHQVFIAGYEIDVKATIGDRTIAIECKNYQSSNLTIRNLIHQWNSKNQVIRAHKIILVLAGLKISDSDYALASQFDMEIWSQEDIGDLFNLSLKPIELRERLLTKISLKPITIVERYRDDITYLIIKPLLSFVSLDNEVLYKYLNKWLRAFIITELQMSDSTAKERALHIELFENTRMKKNVFNLSKKRSEVEYWNVVLDQLSDQDLIGKEKQIRYIKYMYDLVDEYNNQLDFFEGRNFLDKTRKLIASRLYYATIHDQVCMFSANLIQGVVKVSLQKSGGYVIDIAQLDESQGNVLNWILTSEYSMTWDQAKNVPHFYWYTSSIDETVEKVYRIFTEYFSITEKNAIRDLSIK